MSTRDAVAGSDLAIRSLTVKTSACLFPGSQNGCRCRGCCNGNRPSLEEIFRVVGTCSQPLNGYSSYSYIRVHLQLQICFGLSRLSSFCEFPTCRKGYSLQELLCFMPVRASSARGSFESLRSCRTTFRGRERTSQAISTLIEVSYRQFLLWLPY